MSTTAPIAARQPKGIPTGGEFAAHDRAEAEIGLNWPATPSPVHVARARDEASRRHALLGSFGNRGISYEDVVTSIAQDIADQEAAYDAWRRGETHPDDAVFDAIWDGHQPGMSQQQVLARIEELEEQERVIPTADQATLRRLATVTEDRFEMLALVRHEREHYEEALRCGGKNLSINQAVILRDRNAATPF